MNTPPARRLLLGTLILLAPLAVVDPSFRVLTAEQKEHQDRESMHLVWRQGLGRSIVIPPFITPAGMVVATTDSKIHMIDPLTGKRVWRRSFKAPIETAPVWAAEPEPGILLVSLIGSRTLLKCLDLRSGKDLWNQEHAEPLLHMKAQGDRVWIMDRAGLISCRRTDSGELLWSRETGAWRGPEFLLTDNRLFLLGRADSLTAVDPELGSVLWSKPLTGRFVSPPVIAGGDLVVIDFDGRLFRIDPDSGALLDEEQRDRFQSNPPLALDGDVITVSDGGIVERRGREGPAWRVDLELAVSCGVVRAGGDLLISGVAGTLQAIEPDAGTPLWSMEFRGGLRAPPLLYKDRLILATGRGEMHVHSMSR